jgi:HAD superfamily hydrolase (TIGR01484 family)
MWEAPSAAGVFRHGFGRHGFGAKLQLTNSSTIGAVLVDCDGTLAPRDMVVTGPVRAAITQLAEQVPVGIVSSRDHLDIRWLAGELGFTAPQVSEGGARVFSVNTQEPLWVKALEPGDARSIVEFLVAEGHSFNAIDGLRRVSEAAEISDWQITRLAADSLLPEQAKAIAAEIGETMDEVHAAVIIRTDNGEWMIDFTHAEATKASGAAQFAKAVGVPLSQVVGAGDSFNDLPLLRACGTAIAMGQAPQSLKEAADYVAPSAWEDGLAVAIDEFIAPRLA